MPLRIALATYERAPGLAPDDRPLVGALATYGASGTATVWSDEGVDWRAFDAVILRSCWDYHRRLGAFLDWLDRLDALAVPVWNSSSLVRWNTDKRYLLDLAARGVATIPTSVVPAAATSAEVEAIALDRGWVRVVVKPTVSASGFETHALATPFDDSAHASVARALTHGSLLVQPFADEVPSDGELSFIFIDGVFSHATRKRAMKGEFRVQTDHGGSVERATPADALVREAFAAIEALPQVPLYARVDGIVRDGAFVLMELELIEPNLFLSYSEGAADRFARAIIER